MANSFLQSGEWEKFQNIVGRQTFRIHDLLFIRLPLPLNKTYLYCPRFELHKTDFTDIINKVTDQSTDRDIFIRFEPEQIFKIDPKILTHQSPSVQPKQTLVLDLTKTEDQLLLEMKPKTRYNIRLAQKKNVEYRMWNIESFNEIWKLMQETAKRDKFSLHAKNYYQKMLEVLGENGYISLLTATHEGDLLAGMILIHYQDQAIYLHGASSSQKRNLMAPYLLHWEAIRLAKSRGCQTYDFWGINTKNMSSDQINSEQQYSDKLDGVTKFKLGFGGQIINYPDCFEVPIHKKAYFAYRTTRKIHRLIKPRTFE